MEGEVVLPGQQSPELAVVGGDNHRLAPGKTMPRRDVASAPALLEELFDHTQGNTEAVSNFGPAPLVVVIRREDSFTEIQRKRSHVQILPALHAMATLFIEML